MPDRRLTDNEIDELARSHNTHSIVAAGNRNGTNQFLTIVTAQGLQELATSGRITQRQHDLIVQRATFDERGLQGSVRRYIVTFEGPDSGHLTATRAFSAEAINLVDDRNLRLGFSTHRTLNLQAGDNPSAQSVRAGAGSEEIGGIPNFELS